MATTIKLEGEARSEFGKGVARRLRVANKIPATIYAGGEEPAFVTLPMRETTLALRHQRPVHHRLRRQHQDGRRQGRAEEPGQAHHRAR